MLLAGLERHAQSRLAVDVNGAANDAARHKALVGILAGKKGRMRTAVAHGNAHALRGSKHDVGTPASGRRQEGKGEYVGRHREAHLVAGAGRAELHVVPNAAAGRWVLHQCAKECVGRLKGHGVAEHQLNPDGLRPGLQQGLGLGVDVVVHEKL